MSARRNTLSAPRTYAGQFDEPALPVKVRLLRAGTMLFAERGFDATSVQAIVEAAGVSKGAFYHYFTAKEDLLYEIHNEIVSTELADAERILAQDLDPDECLSLLIVDLIESIARFQAGVTVFFREMHRLPYEKWRLVQEVRRKYSQLYVRVISRGQIDGFFRTDMNPKVVTYALLGTCNWFYAWYSPSGTWSAHELGRQLAGVYLNSLQPVDAGPPPGSGRAPSRRKPNASGEFGTCK